MRGTWAVAAVVLLGALGWSTGAVGQGQGGQGAAGPGGAAAFAQAGCAACHGPDGRGTLAAPSIAAGSRDLAAFIAYVRRPTGAMPPIGAGVASDQVLGQIYAALYRPAAEAAAASQATGSAGRADAGATIYRRNGCYQCHANEGQGGTQGPRVGPNPIPFARFAWYVRNPTGDMPPYTSVVMSDQDLADVYAFLRARPVPPPVDQIPLLVP
jgi:mono/diheme cytochrome c family protein